MELRTAASETVELKALARKSRAAMLIALGHTLPLFIHTTRHAQKGMRAGITRYDERLA